jgi:hypothetical protein
MDDNLALLRNRLEKLAEELDSWYDAGPTAPFSKTDISARAMCKMISNKISEILADTEPTP